MVADTARTAISRETTSGQLPSYRQLHFDRTARPFLVLWELTRACDLACIHCRAESRPLRDPDELATSEVKRVLDELASLGAPRPIVVLTGGDPFKRPDLDEIVSYGSQLSLRMAVAPSGTPLATDDHLSALRRAGATAVSFSIDGADPESHDRFRRVPGSFELTVNACRAATALGLHLQVNTTVCVETVNELPGIVRLVRSLDAGLWSVFFLVPTGRGQLLKALTAEQVEDVMYFLAEVSSKVIPTKTTEAPQFRRVLVQRESALDGKAGQHDPASRTPIYTQLMEGIADLLPGAGSPLSPQGNAMPAAYGQGGRNSNTDGAANRPMRRPLVVSDGYGVVFISHTGDVSPSGFLPMVVGNVRESSLISIYRESELLASLRNPANYHGRCGICEYGDICGGSRSQAFAAYGDPLAEDPNCPYQPSGVVPRIM
ncbi:MAG: radical SAM protein [Acidimicrobiales bacterium]